MITGLPLDTWVLMAVSTLPGLALVVAAYRIHRRADIAPGDTAEGGPEAPQARQDRSGGRG